VRLSARETRWELLLVGHACFHKKGVSVYPVWVFVPSAYDGECPVPKKKRRKKLTSKDTHQQDQADVEQYLTSACIYVASQQPPPAGKTRKGLQEQT